MPKPATTQPPSRIAASPRSQPSNTSRTPALAPSHAAGHPRDGTATGRAVPSAIGSQLQHQSCGCDAGRLALQLTSQIFGPQIGVPGPGSLAETEIGSPVQTG